MNIYKTITFRCNPTITTKKVSEIQSEGNAIITELIRNKKGEIIVATQGYKRVDDFEELRKVTMLTDCNVIVKTASLSNCSKFYVEKKAGELVRFLEWLGDKYEHLWHGYIFDFDNASSVITAEEKEELNKLLSQFPAGFQLNNQF